MRGWFESTFGAGALVAQFVVALIVVIVLFAIIAAFARRRNKKAGPAQGRGRQPRLAIMDMVEIDDRRKLLLIRRDNVEHLVMIGGPGDLVIESAIMRNRPAPNAADQVPDRTAAGLAMQAHSRAQIRPPFASVSGSANGSGNASGETRTAPPVRGPQSVNPHTVPEKTQEEKMRAPAAGPAQPFQNQIAQTSSPTINPAAVAGLAVGAAALTAAAASVKRREPPSQPAMPPEKPANPSSVLQVGLNGGDGMTTPAPDAGPNADPAPVKPKPVAPRPVATADVTNEATPAADAPASADTDATAKSQQKAAKKAPARKAETTGRKSAGESPAESQPEEAAATGAAAETGVADTPEASLAVAPAAPQDQSGGPADPSAKPSPPTPAGLVETAPEVSAATGDAKAATATGTAKAGGLADAKSFDEIMAEKNAGGDDRALDASPQTDLPASPQSGTAAPDDGATDTAGKTAMPAVERSAAISPFPTIPEDVRRSVLEVARRAEGSHNAGSGSAAGAGIADSAGMTTLGDLAERLEKALAEQASTLSGQLQPTADAKPAPIPAQRDPAQIPAHSIEAWESGDLAPSGQQVAGDAPNAASSAAMEPETAPRQSQAMLEEETDSGVIAFADGKKASPDDKPSDSLEDEMARLLGELTGETSGGKDAGQVKKQG